MRILGIPLKISPFLPLMLLVGMMLGLGAELGIALSSLMLHECCHALAARNLGVRVQEIELMPIGGAARMEDIWSLRMRQVILIALAGPMANLLLILLASSLAWAQILGPYTAMLWIHANLVMMLFNLLPVLPLDGGRIACALLRHLLGVTRTLRALCALGIFAGATLIAVVLVMFAQHGLFNITLLFTGAFLIASARRELHLAQGASLIGLLARQEALADEGTLPVHHIGAFATQSPAKVLSRLRPRTLHRIAVYSDQLELLGILEERDLLDAHHSDSLASLLKRHPHSHTETPPSADSIF